MLFIRDTAIQFPELWLKVYISGPPGDAHGFPEMFARARCYKANTPDEADLVVFTGGPDVNPAYYTQDKPHESVHFDNARDNMDLALYAKCYDEGIPMFGVCRGAQFGHVMNGGELYMDVDNHNTEHMMFHNGLGTSPLRVSSVHHQMCIQNDKMDLIGWAYKSDKRFVNSSLTDNGHNQDVEAFFYSDTCFFGVQGHPEYKGYHQFAEWCIAQIEHLISHNPNVALVKDRGVYRLKTEFLRVRDERPSEPMKETA